MLRDEYFRRLVDSSHIDIYLSGNDGARIYWPWRMQPVHEATESYRDACEQYIIDSSFNDGNIGNEDVLDKAHKLNAEYAVLADAYQDMEGTVDAVLNGLDLYDDHVFEGDIIVPLQAPHKICIENLAGQGIDYVAIGGMKDKPKHKQISATKAVRSVVGSDVKIHGLGFTLASKDGSPTQWIDAIQSEPSLIDSIDTSDYIQDIIIQKHDIDKGEERRTVDCMDIAHRLVRDLRRVSEFVEYDQTSKQSTLA